VIFQCYFDPKHESSLFTSSAYTGLGLEPCVNSAILRNCPELCNPATRLALCEYGGMLNIWRNLDVYSFDWLGFTSYRQLDKRALKFTTRDEVCRHLLDHKIIGWGFYQLDHCVGSLTGAAAQLEFFHPGGFHYLQLQLANHGLEIPARFYSDRSALFASYWAMSKALFIDFMGFSWPIVRSCLNKREDSDYSKSHPKAVGYIVERLFLIWYMQKNYHPFDLYSLPEWSSYEGTHDDHHK
jgi:hypothetical protein